MARDFNLRRFLSPRSYSAQLNPALARGLSSNVVLVQVRYGIERLDAVLPAETKEGSGALKFWTQQQARPGDLLEAWHATRGLLVRLVYGGDRRHDNKRSIGAGWWLAFDYDTDAH